MKHCKTETKTIERQVYQHTTCDKCGEVVPEPTGNRTRVFTLEFRIGYRYPDNGAFNGWSVDLCDTCVEWLRQVLINAGVTLVPVEVEW